MRRQRTKKQLKELVNALAWNDGYGCYTRAGFEKLVWPEIADNARWIIYLDVDDMRGLNAAHTHEGVNSLIKKSLAVRASDYVAGQWFSGDEFIICITEDQSRESSDPVALCARLKEAFLENGVPATFGIAPVISKTLLHNVEPVDQLVQAAKNENRRGQIYEVK